MIIHGDLVVCAAEIGVCICDVEKSAIAPGKVRVDWSLSILSAKGASTVEGHARTVDVVGDDKAKLKEQARRTRIAAMAMEDWRHSES